MRLGIDGRIAVVTGSTRGLGRACATALAAEGCTVVVNGRTASSTQRAADDIAERTGAPTIPVAADVTTPDGRDALLAAVPQVDILVTNNSGPAPGRLEQWDHDALSDAFESNFMPAALLIRSVADGMCQRSFGRIVNITSAMVKSPAATMGLSTAPRTALTAFAKSVSIEVARFNVTVNNLLPYRIDTDRQRYFAELAATEQGITVEAARAQIARSVAAGRMGRPEEFGAACAFLCSEQASFISGQNLQIDGGSFVGLL